MEGKKNVADILTRMDKVAYGDSDSSLPPAADGFAPSPEVKHTSEPTGSKLSMDDLVPDRAGVFGVAVEYSLQSPETLARIRESTANC